MSAVELCEENLSGFRRLKPLLAQVSGYMMLSTRGLFRHHSSQQRLMPPNASSESPTAWPPDRSARSRQGRS